MEGNNWYCSEHLFPDHCHCWLNQLHHDSLTGAPTRRAVSWAGPQLASHRPCLSYLLENWIHTRLIG